MSLLQVNNLDKFYGATPIIREGTLAIQAGEKWGLVGRNGCGKSTLIKVLTGKEDYDQGEIGWAKGTRIGYLEQEPEFGPGNSIYQELRGIFGDLDLLQETITHLQEELNQPGLANETLNRLVEEFHSKTEEFEAAGGYQLEGRIQGVLRGLGFSKERWNDPTTVLSGGERTRLALAKLLLSPNDILFLDEPTNYLDLAAIEWLEEFLGTYRGAVLLVSHDRYFLDRVVSGIIELEFCRIKRYRGNYSAYRSQKEAEYQVALKAYNEQQKELERQEKFVRESRATEKSKRKAHSIEKRLAQVERIERPVWDDQAFKLSFGEPQPSSRKVLELEGIAKRFGNKVLLDGVDLQIEAGEKIGLIGPNGAGKTTLLKMIMGLETPDRGGIRLGHEVHPGYFSQLSSDEDLSGTPFSQISAATDLDNTGVRSLLGRFLFSGEDVFKDMTDLSGGERRRLGLLKLMLSKANFLILDEPTNHLDLDSIEVIEQALGGFSGTVLIVSHDRYFLNRIVKRYLMIGSGRIHSFSDYQEYLDWRAASNGKAVTSADKPKTEAQLYRERSKEIQREIKKKQRNLNEIEADINTKELRQKELLQLVNDPAVHTDYKKSQELAEELAELETALGELYQKWETLQEELVDEGS